MSQPYVKLKVENQVCTIEFFTPQHNALPSAILQQLGAAFKQAAINDDAKVIVLCSAGNKSFCAGASFNELAAITNQEEGTQFFSGFAQVINAMRQCPKLIVGKIQGKAIGGGVGLAAACDYTLATATAEIKLSELSLGIGPFVVGPAIQRKIGTAATYQMTINATQFYTAEWAHQKGLYAEVLPDIEHLNQAADQLATTLAQYDSNAMAAIKNAFWSGTEHWDEILANRAAISGGLVLSNFSQQKIRELKQK